MSQPCVSVVIPTYNRADLLPRALESVAAQTFGDWEVVLVDDGSTDETPRVAKLYARRWGDRFTYVRQDNTGCCAARNRGIDKASGRFIAFLDSDDEFAPNKLGRQLGLFDRCSELGLVYSDYACIDLDGRRIDSAFDHYAVLGRKVPAQRVAPGLFVCGPGVFDVLLRGYFIATIVGLVRREVLDRGIRFMRDPSYAEEWLFYLQVTRACRCGYVDEPLSIHHFTAGSITRTAVDRNLARLYDLLHGMQGVLAPLCWRHRRIIAGHLASACRQVGMTAYRERDFARAARYLNEAFRARPTPRTLYDWADAVVHALSNRREEPRSERTPQDASEPAR